VLGESSLVRDGGPGRSRSPAPQGVAQRTWASARCPIRALAITGIDAAAMIPSIRSGSDIRAMPPSRRMSDRDALQGDDRDRAGVLGYPGLLGGDHVHDHAVLGHGARHAIGV